MFIVVKICDAKTQLCFTENVFELINYNLKTCCMLDFKPLSFLFKNFFKKKKKKNPFFFKCKMSNFLLFLLMRIKWVSLALAKIA